MRVAFVSLGDCRNVRHWSGIPYFVQRELAKQVDHVEIISPLSRWFRWLYLPAKLLGKPVQLDRHPLALRSFARQIQRRLQSGEYDAVVSMSSVPVAALDTDVPILFWTDAVLEGMLNYYPGTFTGMSAEERETGHRQEQAALQRATCAAYSSGWAVGTVRSAYTLARDNVRAVEFGANLEITHNVAEIESWTEQRVKGPLRLLFVGVDWQRKGGAIALETTELLVKRGVDATLWVAGCDSPTSPLIQNFGFFDKSTEEGQSRLRELLRTASFFLLPTRSEAAGIVFAEASAYGLPILATDTGGVSSYVRSGENGFALAPEEPASAYAECILSTFQDEELYRRLCVGAFALYEERFNWRTGVRKLLSMLSAGRDAEAPRSEESRA